MSYADQYLAYGSYHDALMCYEQALQFAEKEGNTSEISSLCKTISWIYEELTEYELAIKYAEKAMNMFPTYSGDMSQYMDYIIRLQDLRDSKKQKSEQDWIDCSVRSVEE